MNSAVHESIRTWWSDLPKYRNKLPAKGTVAGALVVLERLQDKYDLDISSHRSGGEGQIIGAGKAKTQSILERHGETRTFIKEGGEDEPRSSQRRSRSIGCAATTKA